MTKEQAQNAIRSTRLDALEEFRNAVLAREAADKKLIALSTAEDILKKLEVSTNSETQ